MKPWIIVLIVLAVIAVILGLLYYFGKKAQTKQAAQQEQMEAMKQTVSMLIIDKKKASHERFRTSTDGHRPDTENDASCKTADRQSKSRSENHDPDLRRCYLRSDPGKKRSQGYRKRYLYHRSSRHPRFFRAAGKEKRLLAENAPQGTRRGKIKISSEAKRNTLCVFLFAFAAVAKVSCKHGLWLVARENTRVE